MDHLITGILFGLFLAVLLGPIFIVIINATLQQGKKAGFIASSGIWVSDLIFITLSYLFVRKVSNLVQNETYQFWMAITGGIILAVFGIVTMIKKAKFSTDEFDEKVTFKGFADYFMRGFLVNTVNPFTFFFWLTVMTTEVLGKFLTDQQAFYFILGIFCTIILTDSLKVILAGFIRKHLTQETFGYFTKVAGIGLLAFGIYFLYYAFFH